MRDVAQAKHNIRTDCIDMADDTPEHLTGTEARAGSKTGVNRVALFGGLGLVIVIFAIILFVAG
jgi:hypothetical protein